MDGHVPQPRKSRVPVGRIASARSDIDLAHDGLVDDGLLLLLQQLDQPFLGADVALDTPVGVVEEAGDGGLLFDGWEGKRGSQKRLIGHLQPRDPDALGSNPQLPTERCRAYQRVNVCCGCLSPTTDAVDSVGSADYPVVLGHTQTTAPCPQAVDDQISRPAELMSHIGFCLEHTHGRGSPRYHSSIGRHGEEFLLACCRSDIHATEEFLSAHHAPVLRYGPQPLHPGIPIGRIRLQSGHPSSPAQQSAKTTRPAFKRQSTRSGPLRSGRSQCKANITLCHV